MKKIYKYPLNQGMGNIQKIKVPNNSTILDIEFQGDDLFVWILFDDEKDDQMCERKIVMYGTGIEIEGIDYDDLSHIKTIHDYGFVWHYFEIWDD